MASIDHPSTSATNIAEPIPSIAEPSPGSSSTRPANPDSLQTSTPTSDGEDTASIRRTASISSLTARPKLSRRKSSGTMIVPADSPDIELKEETYPPYDARAMSPRRSSAETDRMIAASRQAVQDHALELQSGLDALVNKLEDVQINHDTLQKNNVALQDYIGGLTRSMSKSTDLSSTGRKK